MPAGLKALVNKQFLNGVEMLAEANGFEKGVRFCRTACRPQKNAPKSERGRGGAKPPRTVSGARRGGRRRSFRDAGSVPHESFGACLKAPLGMRCRAAGASFTESRTPLPGDVGCVCGRPGDGLGEGRETPCGASRGRSNRIGARERIRQVISVSALVNFRHFRRFREPIGQMEGASEDEESVAKRRISTPQRPAQGVRATERAAHLRAARKGASLTAFVFVNGVCK